VGFEGSIYKDERISHGKSRRSGDTRTLAVSLQDSGKPLSSVTKDDLEFNGRAIAYVERSNSVENNSLCS